MVVCNECIKNVLNRIFLEWVARYGEPNPNNPKTKLKNGNKYTIHLKGKSVIVTVGDNNSEN